MMRHLEQWANEPGAWRLVVVESPFAGAAMLPPGASTVEVAARVELHREYLADCLADCLRRGEAPFASHGLYTSIGNTTVLDDTVPDDRAAGINAGLAWGDHAKARIVYVDLGVSRGMLLGIARGRALGQRIDLRRLDGFGPATWTRHAPRGCTCAADHYNAAAPFPCEPCRARIDLAGGPPPTFTHDPVERPDLADRAARAAHVAALPTVAELRAEADALVRIDDPPRPIEAGELRERANVLEYLRALAADCDDDLAQFFATTANEIAGGKHLPRAGGGS